MAGPVIGESYNGSITVSKTVHGGSNPSSPARYIDTGLKADAFNLFFMHMVLVRMKS